MDQANIAAIVGVTIGATTIADKLIERLWPSSRVNSILDITLLLLKGVQGAMAVKKVAGRKRPRKAEVVVQAGETDVVEEVEDFPAAMAELLGSMRKGSAASSPPSGAPASRPEYWEREDIKAWAAAHPQLAKALKRKHGLL